MVTDEMYKGLPVCFGTVPDHVEQIAYLNYVNGCYFNRNYHRNDMGVKWIDLTGYTSIVLSASVSYPDQMLYNFIIVWDSDRLEDHACFKSEEDMIIAQLTYPQLFNGTWI